MKNRNDAIQSAAVSRANVNAWAAVIAILEGGLLSGPADHYQVAQNKVIKIANEQIRAELRRYDLAVAEANAKIYSPHERP